jgi:hypothetical protein
LRWVTLDWRCEVATKRSVGLAIEQMTSTREHIDWIFGYALLRRALIPFFSSLTFLCILITCFTLNPTSQRLFFNQFLLFLFLFLANISHCTYPHSYLPLNYHSRSQKLISLITNLALGWGIGITLSKILQINNSQENSIVEETPLRIMTTVISILTLLSCSSSSEPFVPRSLIPPSLPLLFRQHLLTSFKTIVIQSFVLLSLLLLLSLLCIPFSHQLQLPSSGVFTLRMMSRGLSSTIIIHSGYYFIQSSFSIMLSYPMNFSKLTSSSSSSPHHLLFAITGQPRHPAEGKKSSLQRASSSSSYFPFHLQHVPTSTPSLSFTSSTPLSGLAHASGPSSISTNDYHLKWKNMFVFQNQINATLFEYLELNYQTLTSPSGTNTLSNWLPQYEPFILPSLSEMYQLDHEPMRHKFSSSGSLKLWSLFPSALVNELVHPVVTMYTALRQTLALHDLCRVTRPSITASPRKQQLFQSSETIATLTHALLTIITSATLQVSCLSRYLSLPPLSSPLCRSISSHVMDN